MAVNKKIGTEPAFKAPTPVPPTPIVRSESKGSGTTPPTGRATPNPTHQQIAERAYQIYLKRGFGPGNAHTDWLEAERQLKAGL
ncbi:MAG TPA: DUF2934 domain-containing protein [Phycisphaerae bacterium]|nr:DUF2934 domain-containing protein [Phycisphaerae bacterium]